MKLRLKGPTRKSGREMAAELVLLAVVAVLIVGSLNSARSTEDQSPSAQLGRI